MIHIDEDLKSRDVEPDSPKLTRDVDRELLETKLMRKLDLLILPVLTVLFLFIGMERMSLANAKTVGIEADLGLVGNQYYLIVMLGYAPLCLSGVPLAMLTRWIPTPQLIALTMILTGILGICTAFSAGFPGLLAVRFFLGFVEGPLMPLVIAYLSEFYPRGDLSWRFGIWYSAIPFAGMTAGLLSFGVFRIEGGPLKGWQALFVIQGSVCTAFSTFAYFYLPSSPYSWRMLSAEEKDTLRTMLLQDGTHEIEEVISWRDAYRPFIEDWRYGVWALLSFGIGVPLASALNYIPNLTRRLGSDRFRERSLHLALPLALTSIGFILLTVLSTSARAAGYFATFLVSAGCTSPSPLLSVWYTNNTISQTHRIILAGVMVAIGNSAGLLAGNVYMAKEEASGYPTATITTAVFGGMTALGAVVFGTYMRTENARRNKRDGLPKSWGSRDVPTSLLGMGHKAKEFRYMD